MKSTIKIDLESQNQSSTPVIKIIQPIESIDEHSPDFDVRDKLIRDFLHHPSKTIRNGFFELSTYYPHPIDEPRVNVTTIAPIKEENMFYNIRHMVLNRVVPYNSIVELNSCSQAAIASKKVGGSPMPQRGDLYFKIHEFFDWVEKVGYCSFEDQHPYLEPRFPKDDVVLTIRQVFETKLSEVERTAAFNNTPKYKWDLRVNSDYQGLDEAFNFATSPEGLEYWNKVLERFNNGNASSLI